MLYGSFAGLANLDLFLPRFLLVEDLYIFPFTCRTLATAAGRQFPNSFTSVGLSHLFLLLFGF